MIELPTQIRVSDLTKTHREYNLDIIDDYQALYDGGHEFRRRIERFLPRRKIEESAERVNLDGASMYEERKRCAGYVNRAGGLIDWIIAAILRNPPVICLAEDVESVRAGGEPKNPNSYWWSLNHNADGLWTPLRTICARLLRSSMLHNRSYLAVSFPRDEARLADVESLYARFFALGAREVDDWQRDDSGRLLWVRVHTVEMVRENVYSQPTAERHYWTYIDSDAMHVYTAERQLNQYGEARPWRNEDMAVLVSAKAHEFGRLPIFEIRTERGQWVMERIADVAIQLFRRETSLTYSLDKSGYALPILKVESTKIDALPITPEGALRLRPNESFEHAVPPPATYTPLFDDIKRLKEGLYEVLQALALNAAATQTQNARQSAQAKAMDRDPLQTLLASFAAPVEEALRSLIFALKNFLGDVSDVRLLGFDEFLVTLPQARQMILGRPYYGESVQIGSADRDAEYLRAGAGTAAGNTTAAGES